MEKFIPLSVPNLKGNELAYVSKAVETEWVSTAGEYVSEFEQSVADFVGAERAVACQSGTAGLHTALLVCGVTREDMVIVPTLTFIAAVNPVRYIGAEPAFMDCDDSLCMDPLKLEKFCEEECQIRGGQLYHRNTGRRIPAVLVVHVFGNMADMEQIMDIADRYRLRVIEDATEALGTRYTQGKYSGKFAGTIGDVGVYSFNGNKIITTGGGGMLVSQYPEMLDRAKHLTTQAKSDELNYYHDEVGYNYRLTNLQAALGVAQMEQLEQFIEVKRRNYTRYQEKIPKIPGLDFLKFREGTYSNCWFYSVVCGESIPKSREQFIQELMQMGVQSRPIWGLIHEQIPYQGSLAYQIEKASAYWKKVINIPCSTNLREEDVDFVVGCLQSVAVGK